FLIELTEAVAADRGLKVDMQTYRARMEEHEDISRGSQTVSVMAAGPLDIIRREHGDTEFLGYDTSETDAEVVGLIVDKQSVSSVPEGFRGPVGIILNRTPFYGESGGQVGDTGKLKSNTVTVRITDCQKHQQTLFVLEGRLEKGRLAVGDQVRAVVDTDRRAAIRRAHSATHILHHALHQTIGDKATQRGSRVDADTLRFDFAHKQALTADE
ncbi:MAG: alanine--tRNA ligase, partial [Planctomycetaceae bacterium]|nr:alanine--tRNA ligase [Planctomycetaceae bacterium]